MKFLLAFILLCSFQCSFAQHNAIQATNEVRITGSVKNQLTLTVADLLKFKQDTLSGIKMLSTHGNEKEAVRNMNGVLLKTILDSAHIEATDHKGYGELVIILSASDGYENIYSWNELFNNEVGNQVYVITEMDGKPIEQMSDRILVMSLSDTHSGRRHMKCLGKIEVRRIE